MDLTDEDIEEFRDIWKKEFGEEISVDDATIAANNLIELAWLIVQPFPGEPGYRGTDSENPSHPAQ